MRFHKRQDPFFGELLAAGPGPSSDVRLYEVTMVARRALPDVRTETGLFPKRDFPSKKGPVFE